MSTIEITTEHGNKQTVVLPVPLGWKVLVRPKQAPKMSLGGIVLADETSKAEEAMTYVGQILAMGDAAFTATTQGGVRLSHIRKPKVGDWVVYAPFAGQKMRVRGDDSLLVLMNDTELQAVIDEPGGFYSWIDA
jgi:co-chaperonin GroES (HSP10)